VVGSGENVSAFDAKFTFHISDEGVVVLVVGFQVSAENDGSKSEQINTIYGLRTLSTFTALLEPTHLVAILRSAVICDDARLTETRDRLVVVRDDLVAHELSMDRKVLACVF
jgi:hypothetical protein